MKTVKLILLLFVSVSVAFGSDKSTNFERHSQQKWTAAKKVKLANAQRATSAINVPLLAKFSPWDSQTNSWMPAGAEQTTYTNDRITAVLELGYSLLDTFSRDVYTYDGQNRLAMIVTESYFNPSFSPTSRLVYSYSPDGLTTVELAQYYDQGNQTWISTNRYTSAIDARGNDVKYLYESYNNGLWQKDGGRAGSYIYLNSTGKKFVEFIDSSINQTTGQFEAQYREQVVFDQNEKTLKITSSVFDISWQVRETDSFLYAPNITAPIAAFLYLPDSLNNLVLTLKADSLAWKNFDASLPLFENNITYYVFSEWIMNSWNLDSRFSVTQLDNYGSEKALIEEFNNIAWVPNFRYFDIYNSHLEYIEYREEAYDQGLSAWNITYGNKSNLVYDANDNIIEAVYQNYDTQVLAFVNNLRIEFSNFISITAGINSEKNTLDILVYPNPITSGNANVSLMNNKAKSVNLEVVDINGRIVYTEEFMLTTGLNTLKLNSLSQGVYLIKLSNELGVDRTKLIVN